MLNATLISRWDLSSELCILRIRPDAHLGAFAPGQFVRIGLLDPERPESDAAGLVRRAYSIASSPNERDCVELYVVKVIDGTLTPQVWQLTAGDRLWIDHRIQGEFTLRDVPADKELLMVATGTGVAPFVSMLRTFAGTGRWRRFTVVHGVRSLADLGYREELEAAARQHPDVCYVPVVSREPAHRAVPGLRGRVHQLFHPKTYASLTGGRLDPNELHVFLCGNPEMVVEGRQLLAPHGFHPATRRTQGSLHVERYW